ncbi:MAG: hypothetical protein IPG00_09290 [Saprospiraceae bacterium]|nr:hypothetical protein [Saprospiraceae bacterium]
MAFIEGFLVMAIELLSARLVTPVFGSTLYVWTSVLGLTMISLLSGYYLGGRLVSSGNYSKTFIYCLLISATWTLLMPFGAYLILKFSLSIGLILGSLVSITLIFSTINVARINFSSVDTAFE